MTEIWDEQFELLAATRPMLHNEDYWRFLVRDVWRIDQRPCRVVDFGCGYGWIGLFLLPMLAPGSEYVGLDRSEPLLEKGRALFAKLPCPARFVAGEATATSFEDGEFDVAIAHTVLMHLPKPADGLAEMIRVTRDGGLVITCDASQTAINALLHVHETDEQEHTPLALWQTMKANWRRQTGVDRNLGMKTPVLMHQAGLRDVQARISDAVRTSFPPLDTPEKERLFRAICDGGLGVVPTDDESFAKTVAAFAACGISEAEATAELRREIANDYRNRGRDYHIVQPGLMTISFGKVDRSGGAR
jgi:ubiquinone/menaquinone biosynthesis C-methylase UbiE